MLQSVLCLMELNSIWLEWTATKSCNWDTCFFIPSWSWSVRLMCIIGIGDGNSTKRQGETKGNRIITCMIKKYTRKGFRNQQSCRPSIQMMNHHFVSLNSDSNEDEKSGWKSRYRKNIFHAYLWFPVTGSFGISAARNTSHHFELLDTKPTLEHKEWLVE